MMLKADCDPNVEEFGKAFPSLFGQFPFDLLLCHITNAVAEELTCYHVDFASCTY